MEQVKALNALEPFIALSKSATSPRAAADLVTRATSAPNTFIFTELLQTPQVQALASSEGFAPHLTVLEIFSYGTYSSYITSATLPALNDAQKLKLRQLSLLTLAKESPEAGASLSYATLLPALDLASTRELEELVISTIYAGLIDGQLDPRRAAVHVNSVAALRDVAPNGEAIGGLLTSLQAWAGRCEATLRSLEAQMTSLRAEADQRATQAAAWTDKTAKLLEDEQKGAVSSPSNAATGVYQHLGSGGKSSSMLTSTVVGTGNSIVPPSGASGQGPFAAGPSAFANMMKKIQPPHQQRQSQHQSKFGGKRGSGQMDASSSGSEGEASDVDYEAMMDVDDEYDGNQKASRRKL
ncbi:PCI domain-containing protein [Podospora didyma]|uniref:PCI domain-containing protein n=1 Tax=Podospora didyma TaxID=330526 RepID=A0AAE0P5C7_9PEZI|nr:PCI domain-containing protein [Podospora didyma]